MVRRAAVNARAEAAEDEQQDQRPVWEQMTGEPDYWYGRFQVYLMMGPSRTVIGAYRQLHVGDKALKHKSSTGQWGRQATTWRWRARAMAWDTWQRETLALSERNARVALHERRVAVMEDYLEVVREVLDNAHLADADEKQARAWLPQMRSFLLELLVAERQEFERAGYEKGDRDEGLEITADDLRAAQRELEKRLGEAGAALTACVQEAGVQGAGVQGAGLPAGNRLLTVCLGRDSELALDLAVLRAVRVATGLKFARVIDATRAKFTRHLGRERNLGHPVELLHMGLHASAAGVEFVDGVADGNWLSERLQGVRVMLLACCASDEVGDWLGVVPHVISLREEISHEDAALLAQHFWHGIGMGWEAGAALEAALERCPPAVGEYVVRHW